MIVGAPATVKAAVQGWGSLGETSRVSLTKSEPVPRPPPQGPTQDKLAQMELKLTKMVEDVRDGCKREIQSAADSQSQRLLEVQKSTKDEMDRLRAAQTASHEELKKMSQDTQKETQKKMESLDQNMSVGFQKMMEELHRMRQKELKRTASPSPDGECQKAHKN